MKNRRIIQAYDSINPSSADKDRMLQNILAQSAAGSSRQKCQESEVYTAPTVRRRMLPVIVSVAACIAMLVTGGFLLRNIGKDVPEPVNSLPVESELPVSEETYVDVIERYDQALDESWDGEKCLQEGVSVRVADWAQDSAPGYMLNDLNGDGIEELIIGNGIHIWALYTKSDKAHVIQLLSSSYGDDYRLCENGIVVSEFWGKPGGGEVTYYRVGQDSLAAEQQLSSDGSIWKRKLEGREWETISKEAADTIMEGYVYAGLDLTVFSSVPEYLKSGTDALEQYAQILEIYKTARLEKWNPGECVEHGISLMVGYLIDQNVEFGYAFMDLDQDGVLELLITDGDLIYDLFTITDDEITEPILVASGFERRSYRLCEGNFIAEFGSNSAFSSNYSYKKLNGIYLDTWDEIIFDASVDEEAPWFGSFRGSEANPLTEAEAKAVMESYVQIDIPFTPFT